MTYRTSEVRKCTPHIGAEIHGVDLSKPLSDEQFQEVHSALMENLVIFFREQRLSPERHNAASVSCTSIPRRRACSRITPRCS
jgi:taurine dioxygenase